MDSFLFTTLIPLIIFIHFRFQNPLFQVSRSIYLVIGSQSETKILDNYLYGNGSLKPTFLNSKAIFMISTQLLIHLMGICLLLEEKMEKSKFGILKTVCVYLLSVIILAQLQDFSL